MRKTGHALIIFMKAPRLGTVKTRLQPALTPDESLLLYRGMGADLVQRFTNVQQADLFIAYWPPEGLPEMQGWLGKSYSFFPQKGATLGDKMREAFRRTFRDGYQKTVIIGSDLPTLSVDLVEQALAGLDEYPLVLGPSGDGGYYLIGLTADQPALFREVPWSTPEVLAQTLKIAREERLPVLLLPEQRDIDEYEDVRLLWEQVRQDAHTASAIPHTASVLHSIFDKRTSS